MCNEFQFCIHVEKSIQKIKITQPISAEPRIMHEKKTIVAARWRN